MLHNTWDLMLRFLPDLKAILILGPPFLLYTILAAFLAGRLRVRKKIGTPYTRKIFHFSIFSAAGIIHLLAGLPEVIRACRQHAVGKARPRCGWPAQQWPFFPSGPEAVRH
jgi:hypothetical protein